MSLKHFHIFFIMVSIILSAGFGLWCFMSERGATLAGGKVWGTISLIAAVVLVVYAIKVVKKLQDTGIE